MPISIAYRLAGKEVAATEFKKALFETICPHCGKIGEKREDEGFMWGVFYCMRCNGVLK